MLARRDLHEALAGPEEQRVGEGAAVEADEGEVAVMPSIATSAACCCAATAAAALAAAAAWRDKENMISVTYDNPDVKWLT